MNDLSLEVINASVPYRVNESREEGFYEFFTSHDVHYSVGFLADDLLLQGQEAYQLIIANVNHRSSPRDAKVRDTVIGIVDEFFRVNNTTLLYICETGDGKQSMRSRLFEYWFSAYKRKALFTMLSSSVVDSEGIVNYATLILRNDNPHFAQVVEEYTKSIQLLSMKP